MSQTSNRQCTISFKKYCIINLKFQETTRLLIAFPSGRYPAVMASPLLHSTEGGKNINNGIYQSISVLCLAGMKLIFPAAAHTVLQLEHHWYHTSALSIAEQCWHSIKTPSKPPQSQQAGGGQDTGRGHHQGS